MNSLSVKVGATLAGLGSGLGGLLLASCRGTCGSCGGCLGGGLLGLLILAGAFRAKQSPDGPGDGTEGSPTNSAQL